MSAPKRVLLKISGEALATSCGHGIDYEKLDLLAAQLVPAVKSGTQIGLVVGGGNFIRGIQEIEKGLDRCISDSMGMLSTVINGLAAGERLRAIGIKTSILGGVRIDKVCEPFTRTLANECFAAGKVLLLVGGTGNPFFSTDTAAALRSAEIEADILLKATKVDGVYDKDPHKHTDAIRYDSLKYSEALEKRLKVMDAAAFAICQDNNIPIRVFDFFAKDSVKKILTGESLGTLISE